MAGEWMFMHPLLKPLALVWGRFELPGYRKVLNRVAGWDPIPNAPHRRVKGKLHGYRMDLDLTDWSDRWAYFLGRYYEAHVQRLFQLAIRPGDTVVDIGANIGMTSLCAAALVGPEGRVIAFEPNPAVFERLKDHVELNALTERVDIRNIGLDSAPGELELGVPRHTGMASFALKSAPDGEELTRHKVLVKVGDDELAGLPEAPTLIKIDVEGFERRVLGGLERTIGRLKPAVVTEAHPQLLERAGSSASELFMIMHGQGYRAHSVDYAAAFAGWPGTLTLRPVRAHTPGMSEDVLWLLPGSLHEERLAPWIVRPATPPPVQEMRRLDQVVFIEDTGGAGAPPQPGDFRDYAQRGEVGKVTDIITHPRLAYLVEIVDDAGQAVGLVTATPEQVVRVDKTPAEPPSPAGNARNRSAG